MTLVREHDWAAPTRADAVLFALKACVFRLRRLWRDALTGPERLPQGDAASFTCVVASSRAPLWAEVPPAERALQRGKVQNLRVAARRLDCTRLDGGAVFSFWKQLGRASRARGFARGRMLREGCIVPATGGGLCQLSNALYDVALKAGCEIVERHAHSRRVPGSLAAQGRDATVAWNYVDLRFTSDRALSLRVRLDARDLIVELLARDDTAIRAHDAAAGADTRRDAAGCESCDETSCFRHGAAASEGHRAFLVDEFWPEFDSHIGRTRGAGDRLFLPLDGKRWRRPQYGWSTEGFAAVRTAAFATLARAAAMRGAEQGPRRRNLELRAAETLARRFAAMLGADATEVCVTQALLPYLWRDGHLGGCRFSVLMTRLPMTELQARLDAAAHRHPGRKTLADFRADPALVHAESEALAAAQTLVTPHADIAALFGERATLLDWKTPPARFNHAPGSRRIAFPGPTIARKGAFELREAARALDLEVALLGNDLEGADFWSGVRTTRDLDGLAAFVQPALIEDKPRRLLAALASGIPVIATRECGLPGQEGLTLIDAGDTAALTAALQKLFK
ncbi:MAG TPA: VanW family protein [Rhizomicrobium sp.]|jgi:hypothetical protein|nr:VanW family protein [Rhizomicrobium sp.]